MSVSRWIVKFGDDDVIQSDKTSFLSVPQTGWKYRNVAAWHDDDDSLMISGRHKLHKMIFMISFISEGAPDYPDNILLSSNGPSSEKYPDSLGEYQLLQEKSHNGRPVYQSLARDDRYIIYIGNNIIYNYIITTLS